MDESNISANNGSDRATVTDASVADSSAKKPESKEEFVRRQAYEEVNKDMHKFKSRAKDADARAAELEAKLKAIEEDKLKQEQKYQELYEREKKQREVEAAARKKDRDLYLRGLKLAALKAEIGNIRDTYLSHAAIDEIEVQEDGSLNSDSVRSVANKFRQEHPALIPTSSSGGITNQASPTSFNAASTQQKSLSQMSYAEKAAYLKQLKNRS
jgi:hypothetical protein